MLIPEPTGVKSRVSFTPAWWHGLLIVYFLSGAASLAYEVLWSRMITVQFGISLFGVVLTVIAFMLGLGLGSLTGLKWAAKCKSPLAIFAVLEIAIAAYAILIPYLASSSSNWLDGVAPQLALTEWYLSEATESLCLLVIPAFAMGMGFAFVLKSLERTPLTLGMLYGMNTLGGVIGAVLPLWLLPAVGWSRSVWIIASFGFIAGLAALALARYAGHIHPAGMTEAPANKRPALHALIVYAGIGAGSIVLEIGWVRLYGMVLLRTEYVLGVILAVFLGGIAIGSMLLPRSPRPWLAIAMPFAAGLGTLISIAILPVVSSWVERTHYNTLAYVLWSQGMVLAAITLPVTLALGAWLPLLARRYGTSHESGAWLYGANCLGGVFGGILACIVLIPLGGSESTVMFAGLLITALGLTLAPTRWVWAGFAGVVILAWPLRAMPPVHELLPQAEANSRDLYLYEDAISLTQVVGRADGQRLLLSDLQRMDASTEPDAVELQKDQARLALLLHPDPHEVLFLGVGTGISIAGSTSFPNLERSAVELSQGAINAARDWFATVNGNILRSVRVKRDDARHFLLVSRHNYDVIIGDLFHPDMAGMGTLLSVQQFRRASDHLAARGVFVQWLALNQFNIDSLATVLRSFRYVFPDGQMFIDGMHLALVGYKQGFPGAGAVQQNLARLSDADAELATGTEGSWTWMGRYWGALPDTSGAVQDEWAPQIEFTLPRARYGDGMDLAGVLDWLLRQRPDADAATKMLGIAEKEKSRFGRAYVATEMMVRSWQFALKNDIDQSVRLNWLAYQANPHDRWIANALADNMLQSITEASFQGISERDALLRILKVYPEHVGTLRALWHLENDAGNRSEAERYRLQLAQLSPLDAEANRGSNP